MPQLVRESNLPMVRITWVMHTKRVERMIDWKIKERLVSRRNVEMFMLFTYRYISQLFIWSDMRMYGNSKMSVNHAMHAKPCLPDQREISRDSATWHTAHASRPGSIFSTSLVSHQTSHLLPGFMGVPGAQENCSANSREFDNGPRTRNIGKLCESPIIDIRLSSGRLLVHHTYKIQEAQLSQIGRATVSINSTIPRTHY